MGIYHGWSKTSLNKWRLIFHIKQKHICLGCSQQKKKQYSNCSHAYGHLEGRGTPIFHDQEKTAGNGSPMTITTGTSRYSNRTWQFEVVICPKLHVYVCQHVSVCRCTSHIDIYYVSLSFSFSIHRFQTKSHIYIYIYIYTYIILNIILYVIMARLDFHQINPIIVAKTC